MEIRWSHGIRKGKWENKFQRRPAQIILIIKNALRKVHFSGSVKEIYFASRLAVHCHKTAARIMPRVPENLSVGLKKSPTVETEGL